MVIYMSYSNNILTHMYTSCIDLIKDAGTKQVAITKLEPTVHTVLRTLLEHLHV